MTAATPDARCPRPPRASRDARAASRRRRFPVARPRWRRVDARRATTRAVRGARDDRGETNCFGSRLAALVLSVATATTLSAAGDAVTERDEEVASLRARLHAPRHGETLRAKCVRLRDAVRSRTCSSSEIKGRLARRAETSALAALERWATTARAIEVDLERIVRGDVDKKSLSAMGEEVTRALRDFEWYLRENDVMEDLPFVVDDDCETRSSDETTIDLMRKVLEKDVKDDDASIMDTMCDELRARESDYAWRGALLGEVENQARARGWSSENFSYGSTPFASWVAVFVQCDELRERAKTLEEDDLKYVVFGSSAGWLVFYAATTFRGARCEGFEILETLHATASHVLEGAEKKACKKFNVNFCNADMLSSSLCDVGIIVLTSMCWDDAVYDAVLEKLAEELRAGAFVIDYRGNLAQKDKFALVSKDSLRAPVSWNPGQRFYVFKKVA